MINAWWTYFERQMQYYYARCKTDASEQPMCITSSYIWVGMRTPTIIVDEELSGVYQTMYGLKG